MGREVRRVPADWQHPKNEYDRYKPMFDEPFEPAMRKWIADWEAWERGERPEYCSDEGRNMKFWEFEGGPPDPQYYRPDWNEADRTHYMMYEDTSEGTPISPAFATPEELARWLADTGASSFGDFTASYEAWLRVANGGYAPSAVYTPGCGLQSGVEAL